LGGRVVGQTLGERDVLDRGLGEHVRVDLAAELRRVATVLLRLLRLGGKKALVLSYFSVGLVHIHLGGIGWGKLVLEDHSHL